MSYQPGWYRYRSERNSYYRAKGVYDHYEKGVGKYIGEGMERADADRRAMEDTDKLLLSRGIERPCREKAVTGKEKKAAKEAIQDAIMGTEESSPPAGTHEIDASTFKGKTCSTRKSIEWAMRNYLNPDVKPSHAPSADAWVLLDYMRESKRNRNDFISNMWGKLMPNQKQLEAAERVKAGSTRLESLIQRVREYAQESTDDDPVSGGAEDAGGESRLQATPDANGVVE